MRSMRLSDSLRKNQLWNGQVTITLLEGRNIPFGGLAEVFILLKLGDQRYKSKVSTQNFLQFGTILESCCFFFFFIEVRSKAGDQIKDADVLLIRYIQQYRNKEAGSSVSVFVHLTCSSC